jgi:hypothetical protein
MNTQCLTGAVIGFGLTMRVPETRFKSCYLLIFVNGSSEPVQPVDADGVGLLAPCLLLHGP